MPHKDFTERLLEVIHVLRIEQQEFGKTGGVSKGTFSNYALGNSQPKVEALARWVDTYNINANWLLIGEGEMFRGEGTSEPVSAESEDVAVTDPIAQRMKVAVDLLNQAGASPEVIQQAIMKILDSQNEPHTEVEEKLHTPAFANDRDRSIKRS